MNPRIFSFPMSEKTSNHMRAPQSASFVAQMRNVFGNDNVQVTYVKEKDLLLGDPSPQGGTCVYKGSGDPMIEPVVPKKRRKAA
jgi:hypothetical protein